MPHSLSSSVHEVGTGSSEHPQDDVLNPRCFFKLNAASGMGTREVRPFFVQVAFNMIVPLTVRMYG